MRQVGNLIKIRFGDNETLNVELMSAGYGFSVYGNSILRLFSRQRELEG